MESRCAGHAGRGRMSREEIIIEIEEHLKRLCELMEMLRELD